MPLDPEALKAKAAAARKTKAARARAKQAQADKDWRAKLKAGRAQVRKELKSRLVWLEEQVVDAAEEGQKSYRYHPPVFKSRWVNDHSEASFKYEMNVYELEYIAKHFKKFGFVTSYRYPTGTTYGGDGAFSNGICEPLIIISWDGEAND